ncbi:MAG: RNAse P, Rpr2/Rpp21 subunit [Candidatus Aramenus sulfurataquae]|jgi:ribonuclease P protein subunit RPR2|uniref:Ribonuclease P protein component 4 n=2 Tax=Candidatus Aramenus sulfurataquae TaxID=1326980 RepID=W7KMN4_9CREN|nr:MAG: RNAse P, Rpr2/Rpp21 subunit [Candidatus Aramenus sulfurataquae]MBW9140789.1 hypothetical protein [Candidatus Aramenus sp.]MCL7343719.1 hypothetical protein [Candidatus Aramenus sulfurataquae]
MKGRILRRAVKLIDDALDLARRGEIELARDYVTLAKEYCSKTRTKLPLNYKRKVCRKCNVPLIPGVTERRRIRGKILIRTCLLCGWTRRYDLRKNKGENKEAKDGRNRR